MRPDARLARGPAGPPWPGAQPPAHHGPSAAQQRTSRHSAGQSEGDGTSGSRYWQLRCTGPGGDALARCTAVSTTLSMARAGTSAQGAGTSACHRTNPPKILTCTAGVRGRTHVGCTALGTHLLQVCRRRRGGSPPGRACCQQAPSGGCAHQPDVLRAWRAAERRASCAQGEGARAWSMVWLAPVSLSSAGRSADKSSMGTLDWLASTTDGSRLATAVPEVVITTAGTGRGGGWRTGSEAAGLLLPAAHPPTALLPAVLKAASQPASSLLKCPPAGSPKSSQAGRQPATC